MADESDDDKTEEPTEKRIADALDRGDTPVSREIAFLCSLCAYLIVEIYALPAATPGLVTALVHFLDDPSGWRLETSGDVMLLFRAVALIAARFAGPIVFLMMVFGVGGSIVQNAPRVVLQRIAPNFQRLSPLGGFTRLFGPRGWTEFAKSALKLAAVAASVAMLVASQRFALIDAMFVDPAGLPARLISLCVMATTAVMLAVLVIAGADLTWTRIHWRRDQRMSRHEVKEEVKQAEGDRMLKARLRSLRLDRSRRNMLQPCRRRRWSSSIRRTTRWPCAMCASEGGAPVVLAKGVDLFALKIREIAFENDIPVIEDKPLARSLYEAVAVDAVIPPEFYRAVAEIVHLIQSKRAAWPLSRRRLN